MVISQLQIEKIIFLAKAYGATRLIIFGSASETPNEARDLDLACEGVPGWKLYELAARLEEELHTPLDIIPLETKSRFTRLIEDRGKVLL